MPVYNAHKQPVVVLSEGDSNLPLIDDNESKPLSIPPVKTGGCGMRLYFCIKAFRHPV